LIKEVKKKKGKKDSKNKEKRNIDDTENTESNEVIEEEKNKKLNCSAFMSLMPKTFYYIFNLFLVFLFEYVIITSFANVMDEKVKNANPDDIDKFYIKDYFVVINICYQAGAFLSRSSLEYVKVPRVWLFTFIQGINFLVVFFNTDYFFIPSLLFMCPMFIWVGLMGGASYVNVVNCLLQLDTLK